MTTATTPKPTAADRRHAGINRVASAVRDYDATAGTTVWHLPADRAAEVAAMIRDLAPLGRTDRWRGTVEGWAVAVETAPDADQYRWAFDQHGIWAAYAAD